MSTWAACLQWRLLVAIWRRSSRGETCWRSACALCRSGRIIPKQRVCNSKTGACWRGPLSVELTRRWRHRVGVFFDAVAAALGCAPATLSYEGEAACALEALAASCHGVTHPVTMPRVDNQLDLATFWQQWLNWQAPVNQRAWAFHDALAQGFAALMREQATMRGITTLVFSGGVIHNRLLRARLAHYLADFTLLFPQSLPAGDGGLSLGQGVIAAARWLAGEVQNG
ncbi:hydrogenase maturation protein hypF [Escherichia coli]|nr:hydrogenase maturation protein hypF [Escherichia coli]